LILPVHDRMPVILPKGSEAIWIDLENQNGEQLLSLLTPYPAEEMKGEELGTGLI